MFLGYYIHQETISLIPAYCTCIAQLTKVWQPVKLDLLLNFVERMSVGVNFSRSNMIDWLRIWFRPSVAWMSNSFNLKVLSMHPNGL